MPRTRQHVLRRLLDAKLLLEFVLSEGLDSVLVHHFLQILGRDAVITIQAVWEIEDSLDLKVQKVPCRQVDQKIFLVLSIGDCESLPNICKWPIERHAKREWIEFEVSCCMCKIVRA